MKFQIKTIVISVVGILILLAAQRGTASGQVSAAYAFETLLIELRQHTTALTALKDDKDPDRRIPLEELTLEIITKLLALPEAQTPERQKSFTSMKTSIESALAKDRRSLASRKLIDGSISEMQTIQDALEKETDPARRIPLTQRLLTLINGLEQLNPPADLQAILADIKKDAEKALTADREQVAWAAIERSSRRIGEAERAEAPVEKTITPPASGGFTWSAGPNDAPSPQRESPEVATEIPAPSLAEKAGGIATQTKDAFGRVTSGVSNLLTVVLAAAALILILGPIFLATIKMAAVLRWLTFMYVTGLLWSVTFLPKDSPTRKNLTRWLEALVVRLGRSRKGVE